MKKEYRIEFFAKDEIGQFAVELKIESDSYEEAFIKAMNMVHSKQVKWDPKTIYFDEIHGIGIYEESDDDQ